MTISSVTQSQTVNPVQTAMTQTSGTDDFSSLLSAAVEKNGAEGKADIVSGRIGIDYESRGMPYRVSYFDENGGLLTTSGFDAESILKMTDKFDIPLTDLSGIGEQLDALGIGYKPYELYPGTGSDHGIDFEDLIEGGMGTAYDWTRDALAELKGPYALSKIEASTQLAESLSLTKNPEVTTEKGIDPDRMTALSDSSGAILNYAAFNGKVASWYETLEEAEAASTQSNGTVVDFGAGTLSGTEIPDTTAGVSGATEVEAAAEERSLPEENLIETPADTSGDASATPSAELGIELPPEEEILQMKAELLALYNRIRNTLGIE